MTPKMERKIQIMFQFAIIIFAVIIWNKWSRRLTTIPKEEHRIIFPVWNVIRAATYELEMDDVWDEHQREMVSWFKSRQTLSIGIYVI